MSVRDWGRRGLTGMGEDWSISTKLHIDSRGDALQFCLTGGYKSEVVGLTYNSRTKKGSRCGWGDGERDSDISEAFWPVSLVISVNLESEGCSEWISVLRFLKRTHMSYRFPWFLLQPWGNSNVFSPLPFSAQFSSNFSGELQWTRSPTSDFSDNCNGLTYRFFN